MSERRGLELSATQLIAGGLATTTAAVISSYLGVAGTVIGAGVMSIVTTAGGAIYQHYLDRGKRRYATLAVSRVEHRPKPDRTSTAEQNAPESTAADETEPAAETRAESVSEPAAETRAESASVPAAETRAESAAESAPEATAVLPRPRPRVRWYAIAGAAVAIFAVVMGGITVVEALANRPISAMLGGQDRSGTSLGRALGGGSGQNDQPVTPSTSPSAVPSESTAPTTSSTEATPGTSAPVGPTGASTPPPTKAPTTPTTAPTSRPAPAVSP